MAITLDCKNHPQVSRFGASRGVYWEELDLKQPVARAETADGHKVMPLANANTAHR
jgi:hypothetical protein